MIIGYDKNEGNKKGYYSVNIGDFMPDDARDKAKEKWRRGNELFQKGDLRKAIVAYKQALHFSPNYSNALYNLSLTYLTLKEYDIAYKLINKIKGKEFEKDDVRIVFARICDGLASKYWTEAKDTVSKVKPTSEFYTEAEAALEEILGKEYNYNKNKAERDTGIDLKINEGDTIIEGQIKKINSISSELKMTDFVGYGSIRGILTDEIILPLKKPELFKKHNVSTKSGILLYGPPGVGKTRLIKSVSGEHGIKLFPLRLNQVLDMYTGNSEKNVHALFEEARKEAPSIIFIDELDAIGVDRADINESGNRKTVNQLLIELDGLESDNELVFVIGATNRPFDIDPALRRSGRFQTEVYMRPPDETDRKDMFRYYLDIFKIGQKEEELSMLAKESKYYSGADIERICKIAVTRKIRQEAEGNDSEININDLLSIMIADRTGGRSIKLWYQRLSDVFGTKWHDYEYPELAEDMRNYV